MNNLLAPTRLPLNALSRIIGKELLQNRWSYIFPGFIIMPFILFAKLNEAAFPIPLNPNLSIFWVILGVIFAIVYGLQGFAGESDRKTLDFLLTRPIHPIVLLLVKYLTGLAVLSFWTFICLETFQFDFSKILVIKGAGSEWILLILFALQSMGVFSGLTTRGAERLLLTLLLTFGMSGLCFTAWNQLLGLLVASYFWFDIPPHQLRLIQYGVPATLATISMLIPMTFTNWMMKGRPAFNRYRPFRFLLFLWIFLFWGIGVSRAVLGPSVWPVDIIERSGDWNLQAGVAFAGSPLTSERIEHLYVAKIGGRAHPVYTGERVQSPRWSPDGKSLVFVDGENIMIYKGKKFRTICQGTFPSWSRDGQTIYYIQTPLKPNKSQIMAYDLNKETISSLWVLDNLALYIATDKSNNIYCILDNGTVMSKNLVSKTIRSLSLPINIKFSMQRPQLAITPDDRLLISTTSEHVVTIYQVDWDKSTIYTIETRSGKEIDPNAQTFIAPDGQGYLCPRIDGAYDYHGFLPPHEHHDGCEHDHFHIHEHHQGEQHDNHDHDHLEE